MRRVLAIIIILISAFSGGSSSGSSSSSSGNSSDKVKRDNLIKKYGERNKSETNLIKRNRDIIDSYLSKVTSRRYSDYDVIDCYNDICVIESQYDKKIKNKYSTPSSSQEREYNLYNTLKKFFRDRQNTLEEGLIVGTQSFPMIDISKGTENIEKVYENIYLGIQELLKEIQVDEYGFYKISDNIRDTDISFIIRYLFDKELDDFSDYFDNLPYKDYRINKHEPFEEYVNNILENAQADTDILALDSSEKIISKIIDKIFGVNKGIEDFIKYPDDGLYLNNEKENIKEILENTGEIYEYCKNESKLLNKRIHDIITKHNDKVILFNDSYAKGESLGITKKSETIIESLSDKYCCGFELGYDENSKILIIEYNFPSIDDIPRVKVFKQTGKDVLYSETAIKKLYDKYMYSVCIKILYTIYDNDTKGYIKGIVFNGIVTSIDKRFGNERTDCILTISTEKSDLKDIILENIDPKETFKALRGVSAVSLSSLTPVPPISTINKNDKRFVEGYNVIDTLDNSVNLACMDWQDFENLIRDLFGKIYAEKGGEVKITQASRDGGVDAVAFDPDPVTGGKILIQAKRYTNVVGVGAVRDLAGAVHHEGAMKGILVTTSSFGHDAMKFVAKEPISLINGQNLLSLLNKYGYKAHIDIKEARKILKEQEKNLE